ncbi:50S ribosomal protein L31 [Candidatus Vidania fulgoroideae]|uniref:50S ribosomal protein L31 n=1 Tax=Candidatus Vidania fulgoroideorum TaxID=881286 RepID=A0A974X7D1_9PROT|nr:50S ribosomal protein L31 [Candidatus Vidania fulgoroideae]
MRFYKTTFVDKITKKKFIILTGSSILSNKTFNLEVTSDSHPYFKSKLKKKYYDSNVSKFVKKISISNSR